MDKFLIRKSSSSNSSSNSGSSSTIHKSSSNSIKSSSSNSIKSSSNSIKSSSSNIIKSSSSNSIKSSSNNSIKGNGNDDIDIDAIFSSFLNSSKSNTIVKKNSTSNSIKNSKSSVSKAHSSSHKTITKTTISTTISKNGTNTAKHTSTNSSTNSNTNINANNQENEYFDNNIVYINDNNDDNMMLDNYDSNITMVNTTSTITSTNTNTNTEPTTNTDTSNVVNTNPTISSSISNIYHGNNPLIRGNRTYPCVPFSFDPRRVNHPLYYTNMCYSFTQGRLCAKSLKNSSLIFGHEVHARSENCGISAIKFDHFNTYFAASSCSNGLVNIYYFQECLTSFVNNNKHTIMADITLDTKRAISDICWSINNPNELVVAFSFQSLLYVYDLEEPEHPSRVLESGKDSSSGGGYKVVINIEKTVTKNGVDVKKEMIIAGTSYGYIRMWDGRNDKRPVWDFQADSQAALKGSPVVSIIPISNMTSLVSVTESGIISVWDLNNLTVAAFMSEAKPSCIKRMCIWQDILQSKSNISGTLCATLPYKNDTNTISITFKNNIIIFVNITDGSISSLWNPSLQAKTNKISILSKENQSELVEGNSYLSAHPSNTIYPSWGHSRYSIRGIHGTVILRVTDHTPLYDTIDNHRAQNRNKFDSYLTHNDNGIVSSNFYKSDRVCMTLPGNIISAEKGSNSIIVSKDLKAFLTSNTSANSTISLSSTIYFDWSSVQIYDTTSKNDYHKKGSHNTVSYVYGLQLILEDPYWGPDVTNGSPKVYLRTNLVPGTNATTNVDTTRKMNDVIDHVVDQPITCLAAHPELPYIVAGDKSGNICIYGSDINDNVLVEDL